MALSRHLLSVLPLRLVFLLAHDAYNLEKGSLKGFVSGQYGGLHPSVLPNQASKVIILTFKVSTMQGFN
jgi:hypothetical protein